MDLLIKRLENPAFMRSCVFDGDVHAQDPKDIFPDASHRYGFFYSHLPLLYPNTTHVNRLTPSGEWMLSNGVPIKKNDKVIGFKNIFRWHEGDLLTNWTMEEYQLSSTAILKLPGKLKNEETMKKIQQLVVCRVEEGAQIIK